MNLKDMLPDGAELGKVFTGHGKAFNVNEEVLTEEYIEIMQGLEEGLEQIAEAWIDWKTGPLTDREHIEPARKEVLKFCIAYLKKNIK